MSDRGLRTSRFLSGTQWQDWKAFPLASDASARRYWRLTGPAGRTAILMDADPATGENVTPFLAIAQWLIANGLSAPGLLHGNVPQGLLLIDDLGPETVAAAAANVTEDILYDAAVDVLVVLDRLTPPPGLKVMTPGVGAEMVAITAEAYHPCDPAPLVGAMRDALAAHAPTASHLALRDYHAENLIWQPQAAGLHRIGLLDFQDAFVAPRGYDLASLLRDIRRTVSAAQVTRQTARFAAAVGIDPDALAAQLATLGAQRNLRILGVFARLDARGKPRYADMLPRVWDQLLADLDHPALTDLRRIVVTMLPRPQDRR
ncbi:aminoglycoside phosphotransferase family protein [Loktanella sp. DJP18]|uniref:aminoglycoside phosphotransferase family protein n=1 Tax=Loktanella sp. DJP18 TaxID=3409788 RepID=UPI003BB5C5B2